MAERTAPIVVPRLRSQPVQSRSALFSRSSAYGGRLPTAGQVRDDAEYPLDQHQLPAMVHLVFFYPEQHLESRFLRGLHRRCERDHLGKQVRRHPLHRGGERLATRPERVHNLILALERLLFRQDLRATSREEREIDGRDPLAVHLYLPPRGYGDMGEDFSDALDPLCCLESVLVGGGVLRNLNGIFTNGSKTLGDVPCSVHWPSKVAVSVPPDETVA